MPCGTLYGWAVLRFLALLPLQSMLLAGCSLGDEASEELPTVIQKTTEQPVMPLQVTLDPLASELSLGESVQVRVSIHNAGSEPATYLPMNTALENPLQADVFEVSLNNEKQPYIGILAQRLPPQLDDFVMLEPGDQLDVTFDLSLHYLMNQPGHYQVRYAPRTLTIDPALGVEVADVSIATRSLSITIR